MEFCTVCSPCLTSRFANHQLGLDRNLLWMVHAVTSDAPQNGLGGNLSHLAQGLPHGGEPWVLERGALDVVEADHRDVFRHPQFLFPQGADSANCGNVIERKYRREGLVSCQQPASDLVT